MGHRSQYNRAFSARRNHRIIASALWCCFEQMARHNIVNARTSLKRNGIFRKQLTSQRASDNQHEGRGAIRLTVANLSKNYRTKRLATCRDAVGLYCSGTTIMHVTFCYVGMSDLISEYLATASPHRWRTKSRRSFHLQLQAGKFETDLGQLVCLQIIAPVFSWSTALK